MVILVAFNKLSSCKSKHHNVLITNPLLIWSRVVSMEFITCKLLVQVSQLVILLNNDAFKVVILTYSYHTGHNVKQGKKIC